MDFIRSVGETQYARHRIGRSQTEVIAGATTTVSLNRSIDDLAGHVRHRHLDHRDLGLGDLVANGVHTMGGM